MRCGEMFWKRTIPFVLTFSFGLLFSGLFFTSRKEIYETKPKIALIEIKLQEKKNCISKTELEKPFKFDLLNELYFELTKEKSKIKMWLEQNANASEKEKSTREKELESIDFQIAELKRFEKSLEESGKIEESVAQNLLYLEKCYEF